MAGRIVSEKDGSETTSAPRGSRPNAGERLNAATLTGPNLDMRLEHELQTVVERQRVAPPQFLSIAAGIGAITFQRR